MSMMFEEFLRKYPDRSAKLQEILVDFNSNEPSRDAWNASKERCEATELAFQTFLTEMSSTSQSFAFWNTYVSELYPIARDLTNSLHCGDWILYLSAVERATSLFFSWAERTTVDGHHYSYKVVSSWTISFHFFTNRTWTVDLS